MPPGVTFFDTLEVQAAKCGIFPTELYNYTPRELYNIIHAGTLVSRERWEVARFVNPNATKVIFPWEGNGNIFTNKERMRVLDYIEKQRAMGY